MKNDKGHLGIEIKFRKDGSMKGVAKNSLGEVISTVSYKNKKFNKIVKKKNNRGETAEVIHSAWGSNFYHEDLKSGDSSRKIDKQYCKHKLNEKQNLAAVLRGVVEEDRKKR